MAKHHPENAHETARHHAKSPAVPLSRFVAGTRLPAFLTNGVDFHVEPDALHAARIQGALHPVPPPRRDPPVMKLTEVIGDAAVQEILHSGQIVFHTVGDTGKGQHTEQTDVAALMTDDFNRPNPADHPAFFFHLGDVIYGPHKVDSYQEEFYNPYASYPGKIVAIAGNHDGEVLPSTDPDSLTAFLQNFVAPGRGFSPSAGSQVRETMTQPGVYFLLEAPFVRILGLYSNSAENPGFISGGVIGGAQKQFLVDQLTEVARKRKADGDTDALVVAVHHPPFSGGGHSGSREMLADMDDAFHRANIVPDVVLSGHAHNYQRFTRTVGAGANRRDVPFLVAGSGGHGLTPIRPGPEGLPARTPISGDTGDHSLRQYYNGSGYLYVTVTRQVLTIDFYGLPATDEAPLDSITLDLRSHRLVHETAPLTHPLPGEVTGVHRPHRA
jgi:predicted phosphodiesterase